MSEGENAMKALLILVASMLLSVNVFAGVSAVRLAGEDFTQAAAKSAIASFAYQTPQRLSRPLKDLNISQVPDVGSFADLENQFNFVRDTRFMHDSRKNMDRRLTWLYPDDGCYARAEMAAHMLAKNNFVQPKKIFVFGNLRAATNNTPGGTVEWWYHVAVTYRIDQTLYVFDPAIDPSHPLTLNEWHAAVGGNAVRPLYAICDSHTFDPNQDCVHPEVMDENFARSQQNMFLYAEWQRVLSLGRNPEKELGDFPPWK